MDPSGEPPDAYAATHIRTTGAVVHRDKVVARAAFWAMLPMALIALVATVAVASGAEPSAPRIAALFPFAWFALTAWVMLTKISTRSIVTTTELQVHWGLRRWTIALDAIRECRVVPRLTKALPAAQFAVNAWAPEGMVLIEYRDAAGKDRKVQFSASDPGSVAAAIERARDGARGGDGLRVHAAPGGAAPDREEALRAHDQTAAPARGEQERS